MIEELEPGVVPTQVKFDKAFEIWKNNRMIETVYQITNEWGLDGMIFEKSVEAYSASSPDDIPLIDDLISSLDFTSATKPLECSQLDHNMELTKELSKIIPKIKVRYD